MIRLGERAYFIAYQEIEGYGHENLKELNPC